jgi:hypothetical protein
LLPGVVHDSSHRGLARVVNANRSVESRQGKPPRKRARLLFSLRAAGERQGLQTIGLDPPGTRKWMYLKAAQGRLA